MKKLLKKAQAGFTLIELLVVVGILSLLAVAALVAINPAEAQKKARDSQRLKDVATIQSVIEQYLTDNLGSSITKTNSGDGAVAKRNCSSGWFGFNACPYINVLPVDPSSKVTQVTTSAGTKTAQTAAYYVNYSQGAYTVCIYLESTSNKNKLIEDGGTDATRFEVFSGSIACQ